MFRAVLYLTALSLLGILGSCTDPVSEETFEEIRVQPIILGHRGVGTQAIEFGNTTIFENTFPAVALGLNNFHGVEIDIQMSLDGTLWLFHDGKFQNHRGEWKCIPQSSDYELAILADSSHRYATLTPLDTVFQYHRMYGLPQPLSLDVKGYFDSLCFPQRNADRSYLTRLADSLVALIQRHEMQAYVMIETNYQDVLKQVRLQDTSISCYLLTYSNFDRAMEHALTENYQGLSSSIGDTSLSANKIFKARSKGLKVQLWTPNDSLTFKQAWKLNPDFIQTDNRRAMGWIKHWQDSIQMHAPESLQSDEP